MTWRRGTLFESDQVYFSAALLAAHASYKAEGLRQRDLKFFFELFRSWSADFFHGQTSPPCNMQVARALKRWVAAGYAKSSRQKKLPRYRLTQEGLLYTLRCLIGAVQASKIEQSIFIFYFISSYREKLITLVRESMQSHSEATAAEVVALLDNKEVQRCFLKQLDQRIELFKRQIQRSEEASKRAQKLKAKGARATEITAMLQKDFPYSLNAQRPLGELYKELPADISLWEITEGPEARSRLLWKPLLYSLEHYRKLLSLVA